MMRSSASVSVGDCRGGTPASFQKGTRNVTNQLVAGEIAFGCTGIARVFDLRIEMPPGRQSGECQNIITIAGEHAREWLDRQHYEFGAV
jgi:hypothetical protein